MSEGIRYQVDGAVATITLDRPEVRNALGPAEWHAIDEGVMRAGAEATVRVLVVTGAGGVFSAGGDVKSMPERLALPPAERRAQLIEMTQVIRRMRELPKPIIAAIDGSCVGAGLSLALACDLRLATRRARFGAVFHRVGLTGDFGILHLLPRVIGPARALELLLLGDLIDAPRADVLGLVHRVVEEDALGAETQALAERLAAGPPVAMGFTKTGFYRALDQDLGATLEWEAAAQAMVSKTEDAREGLQAIAEKRPPRFTGK